MAEARSVDPLVEEIVDGAHLYSDTVCLFHVMDKALQAGGLDVDIEREFLTPDDEKRIPDFAVLEKANIRAVIEHKGALGGPKNALAELRAAGAKYEALIREGVECKPEVCVLYPLESQKFVTQVKTSIPSSVRLCAYDMTTKDSEIRFMLDGKLAFAKLHALLSGAPVRYNVPAARSSFKFIRSSPHPVYTATTIWPMILGFQDIKSISQQTLTVDRNLLVERVNTFCPPWIRNNVQFTTSRVDAGIAVLAQSGFLEVQGGNKLVVHSRRGTRSGDLLAHFANEYVKKYGRTKAEEGSGARPAQSKLRDFLGAKKQKGT